MYVHGPCWIGSGMGCFNLMPLVWFAGFGWWDRLVSGVAMLCSMQVYVCYVYVYRVYVKLFMFMYGAMVICMCLVSCVCVNGMFIKVMLAMVMCVLSVSELFGVFLWRG